MNIYTASESLIQLIHLNRWFFHERIIDLFKDAVAKHPVLLSHDGLKLFLLLKYSENSQYCV